MRRTLALMLALPATLLALGAPSDGRASDHQAATASVAASQAAATASPPIALPVPEDTGPSAATAATSRPGTTESAGSDGFDADATRPGVAVAGIETTFVVAPVPAEGGVGGSGPVWRYTVEVEPSLGVDPALLATEVRAALHDARSWARDRTMQQVADPSRARIRVVLATPATVDELCGRVGLDTAGVYSCWNGRFAALNAWRWENGADGFPDLTTYRTYLVNHEVGHGLGFGHVGCPGDGALAPVMMQQSKGLDVCTANGWPYP